MNYGTCGKLAKKLQPLLQEGAETVEVDCCGSCHDDMDSGYEACEYALEGETYTNVCCTLCTFADHVVSR